MAGNDVDSLADDLLKESPKTPPSSDVLADQLWNESKPKLNGSDVSGSAADIFFASNPILKSFSEGASEEWGAKPFQNALSTITKPGAQDSDLKLYIKSLNEAFARVPAMVGDAALSTLSGLGRVSSDFGETAVGAAKQIAGENGNPIRDAIAAPLGELGDIAEASGRGEYLPGIEGSPLPHQITLKTAADTARAKGAIVEGEEGFFGTKLPEDPKAVLEVRTEAAKEAGVKPAPVPEVPNIDIHQVARQMNSPLFEEWDAKNAYHDELIQRLNDLQPKPGYEEVPGILEKSPELEVTEEAFKDNYNRLQELQSEVDETYRQASDIMVSPEEAEEIKVKQLETAQTEVSRPVETPTIEPVKRSFESEPGIIADEVTQKLIALGRPEEEAKAAGLLIESHYNSRATRFEGKQGSGYDLYQRDFPTLLRGETGPNISRRVHLAKGSLTPNPDGPNVLRLFKTANASTFIHENGHQWLEEFLADSKHPDAPQDLLKDSQTVRDFLKAKDPEKPFTVAQHEKFARTFERYIREGIAPSKELQGVFDKFKQWLMDIYKKVSDLRAPINDDIRLVFDKLVADERSKPITQKVPILDNIPEDEPVVESPLQEELEQSGPAKNKRLSEIKGTGEVATTGLARRVEAESVENELSEGFEDLPEYHKLVMKDVAQKATDLALGDPQRAYEIAMGTRAAPVEVTPEAVWIAVKNDAIERGDIDTLQDLAHSRLTTEVKTMAQRLRTLNENVDGDPVKAIVQIEKARDEYFQRQNKPLAERLKLRKVTVEETRELVDSAAKVRQTKAQIGNTPAGSPERLSYGNALQDFIDKVNELKPENRTWQTVASDAWNIPKTLQTSILHFSAPFVQGWGMLTTKVAWQGFGQMFKYFLDEAEYRNLQAYILSHPLYDVAKKARLGLTDLSDNLTAREEAIRSTLVEQANQYLTDKTGIPNIVRKSSQAFTGYLNYVRFNRFTQLVEAAKLAGEDTSVGSSINKDLADAVNNFTGRANLGELDKYNNIGHLLNAVFYAPRKAVATFEMFNPYEYVKPQSMTARKAKFRQLTGSLVATGAVLGLASAMGAKVDWDPTSQGFGKIDINGEKIDFTGGNAIYLRLLARLYANRIKTSRGQVVELGQGYKPTTRADLVEQYVRGKLSPMAGVITDWMIGSDAVGNEFSLTKEIRDRIQPILFNNWMDFYNTNRDDTAAYIPALSAMFGVSLESPLPPISKTGMTTWGEPVSYFHDPVRNDLDKEFDRLGKTPNFPGQTINGVRLSPDQYHDYVALSGQMSSTILDRIIHSDGWNQIPDSKKLSFMNEVVKQSRTRAQTLLMMQPANRDLALAIAFKHSPVSAAQLEQEQKTQTDTNNLETRTGP